MFRANEKFFIPPLILRVSNDRFLTSDRLVKVEQIFFFRSPEIYDTTVRSFQHRIEWINCKPGLQISASTPVWNRSCATHVFFFFFYRKPRSDCRWMDEQFRNAAVQGFKYSLHFIRWNWRNKSWISVRNARPVGSLLEKDYPQAKCSSLYKQGVKTIST